MDLKPIIRDLVLESVAAIDKRSDPAACALCREIQAVETGGHQHEVNRDDEDTSPSPIFSKLTVAVHFGDGSDYEIRVCPECGRTYYYCFRGMTYQISYSSNDYDEFNPAREWCLPGALDEVIERVFENYDIQVSQFRRIIRRRDHWWVVEDGGPVGPDEIRLS